MKIKVLKREGNELKFELEGEGHTFCNLLQKVLLQDEEVEMAGYNIAHPLTANPVVYVKTKGAKSPEKVLIEAAEKIKEMRKEFEEALNEALKTKPSSD
ncbi:MAG TPA: DNA-directed RNA polymerase subunit L [Candidatus Bathyarchaeota archaeon]|nr:DNA-directed RNA polymerase subunit L [Candidatus Bathyarchaeota archaeon]